MGICNGYEKCLSFASYSASKRRGDKKKHAVYLRLEYYTWVNNFDGPAVRPQCLGNLLYIFNIEIL